MVVLSYGFKQPQNGDLGSVWFPALNFDIQRLNDHNHDGSNSAFIDSTNIVGGSTPVLSANWVLAETARYTQTLACPIDFNMTDFTITVYDTVTGDIVNPTLTAATPTSFVIESMFNTKNYLVVFR